MKQSLSLFKAIGNQCRNNQINFILIILLNMTRRDYSKTLLEDDLECLCKCTEIFKRTSK